MATKDKTPGLLSKLAQFIRAPAPGNVDPDVSEAGYDSEVSKLALKERIERKRQDDAVRRREFNHLRKLRNNGPVTSRFVAGRPSGFTSSVGFDPDDRAMTIKKIDDIEAQMSKHWWGRKQEEISVPAEAPATAATVARPAQSTARLDAVLPRPPAKRPTPMPVSVPTLVPPVLLTELATAPPKLAVAQASEPVAELDSKSSRHSKLDTDFGGFSNSNLVSVEMGDGLGDPVLQEAAIRFADGDEASAETILLNALQADDIQPDAAAGCAAALFDLYRATGQQASFDVVAMDYAQRFGCSPPEWFSTPDLLAYAAHRAPAQAADTSSGSPQEPASSDWVCPAQLDAPAVQNLRTLLAQSSASMHLHWGALKSIAPDAASPLEALLSLWCAHPVRLHFDGTTALTRTLRACTPAGDPRVDQVWWRLRLDALRILGMHDAFETAALDFCLVYEVSPPSWQPASCDCVHDQIDTTGQSAPSEPAADFPNPSGFGPVDADGGAASDSAVAVLSGEVLGDSVPELDALTQQVKGTDRLRISCALLVRVDFSAAGSILNWAALRQTEGCQVQFFDVPRLVAAFFGVMGITDHAQVLARTR